MTTIQLPAPSLSRAEMIGICGDPLTPPEQLMKMLQQLRSFPTTAGRTLASNPGVPMQGLLRLAGPYPFQVWNNPAFKLQLVATPGFLETIPLRVVARFAGCRDMDEKIIRRLASSRSKPIAVRAAAARNPSCPMT